jgi:hypothetical protein
VRELLAATWHAQPAWLFNFQTPICTPRRLSRQLERGGLFERKRLAANMRIGQKFHLTHPLRLEPNKIPPLTWKDANPCLFGSYVPSSLHLAEEWLQLMRLFETCFEQAWFQFVFCCPHRQRHLVKHISALRLPQPNAFTKPCKFCASFQSQSYRKLAELHLPTTVPRPEGSNLSC